MRQGRPRIWDGHSEGSRQGRPKSTDNKATDLTLDSDEEIQTFETNAAGAGSSRLTHSSGSESRSRTASKPSAQTPRYVGVTDGPRFSTSNSPITNEVRPDLMTPPWACETCASSSTNPWPSVATPAFPLHRRTERSVGSVLTVVLRSRMNSGCPGYVGRSLRPKVIQG